MGSFMQMFRDLLPTGQPVVTHVLPGLVVIPPARGSESVLDLEKKNENRVKSEILNRNVGGNICNLN